MSIIEDLEWRGAINQQTDPEGLAKLLAKKPVTLYCGVDATGDSMHIGHLIPFMVLKRFQLAGHQPIVIIGGATGSIGDPSGRTSERSLQTMEVVQENAKKLTQQMQKLFFKGDATENSFKIMNNFDWLSKISLLEFLRDYGKHFNVNTMLAKDVVASRLEHGISFTEFSYQILQAIDFHYLFKSQDVQLQVGGSDQWGNVTAGLDFIHRMEGPEAEVYGLTIPLMLKSDGTKFGKSAGGETIWLDPEKTTPYEFYQFWLNQADADVIKYLKYFTFLDKSEIEILEQEVANQPHLRNGQRRLAEEITRFVHGQDALEEAEKITQALFTGNVQDLNMHQIEAGFKNMPQANASKEPMDIVVWLVETGIVQSRREAREFVSNGAILINGEKITDLQYEISQSDAIGEKYIIVRRGKKNYTLVTLS
ncbi:tyrosine--tRNA ligase [Facklamia miroungae]|uniref:Tyrosine--tRNA ligase n=1 Tax=Facklamia miroungae TaxID=120956 RepID=A0A1G7RQL4_9LACT|nr:tyrosine--tRNA ligase [Facklamia miroungae]NKZ29319.1 tyrosine--tRNA ligase [Facklamia miroungae]SDG12924.1 tyrosyl-tRNA synthetase [Facklamia miroungae]